MHKTLDEFEYSPEPTTDLKKLDEHRCSMVSPLLTTKGDQVCVVVNDGKINLGLIIYTILHAEFHDYLTQSESDVEGF